MRIFVYGRRAGLEGDDMKPMRLREVRCGTEPSGLPWRPAPGPPYMCMAGWHVSERALVSTLRAAPASLGELRLMVWCYTRVLPGTCRRDHRQSRPSAALILVIGAFEAES